LSPRSSPFFIQFQINTHNFLLCHSFSVTLMSLNMGGKKEKYTFLLCHSFGVTLITIGSSPFFILLPINLHIPQHNLQGQSKLSPLLQMDH
jgi:hypothetical protein